MIKVNQISNVQQAVRLRTRIDIGGICISKSERIKAPYIDVNTAIKLRDHLPELPLSVSFRASDSFKLSEISEILEIVEAKYFEFTPLDFLKKEQFEAQLNAFSEMKRQKIANGFFLLRDDCGFIRDAGPFRRMCDAGVVFFQFEVDSAVDPNFHLKTRDLEGAEKAFSQFPILVSDKIKRIEGYPLKSVQGFFFNLDASHKEENYDYSHLSWSESAITRVLMNEHLG